MKTRSICPSCKSTLEFDRIINNVVKCPRCNYIGSVSNYKELEPETQIPENPSTGKIYKPGQLEFIESDAQWLEKEKTVNLKRGVNTLGRMSSNPEANILLPVNDPFMSRNHAIIDVIMKADGVFEHRLSNNKSKNGTFHNGERLEKGDIIKLMPDDIIKLGHTFLKFIAE